MEKENELGTPLPLTKKPRKNGTRGTPHSRRLPGKPPIDLHKRRPRDHPPGFKTCGRLESLLAALLTITSGWPCDRSKTHLGCARARPHQVRARTPRPPSSGGPSPALATRPPPRPPSWQSPHAAARRCHSRRPLKRFASSSL